MGIVSKAGMLITAAYKGFDKAKGQFSKIIEAAKFASKATLGKDPVTDAARPVSAQSRAIESNIAKMSKLNKAAATTGKMLATTHSFVTALAGVGAFFGIDRIVNGLDNMFDGIVNSQREAAKLGNTFGELMGFQFQLRQLGIDSQSSLSGLTKVYELQNRARIGDVTAGYLLNRSQFQSKFDPKDLTEVGMGRNSTEFFEDFQKELRGIADPTHRAARMLMVLGDDAYKLGAAFVDSVELQNKAAKQANLIFGDPGNAKSANQLDKSIDRMRTATMAFDSAATQFKAAALEIGTEYLSFYGNLLQKTIDFATANGTSLRTVALAAIDKVMIGMGKAANLAMRAVQVLELIYSVTAAIANKAFDLGIPQITEGVGEKGDIKDIARVINEKYDKMMFKGGITPPGTEMSGIFGAVQTANRMVIEKMARIQPLINQAQPIIEQNKSGFQEISEELRRATLLKPVLPKEIFAREMASIINRAEGKTGYLQLQLPQANRMFSVDTESLVNRINMERETKGREPMERLILGIDQLKKIQDEQLRVLESLLGVTKADVDKMVWGKQ